jgi:hypothetical protein
MMRLRANSGGIYVRSCRVATAWRNAIELVAMHYRICTLSPDDNRQFRPPRIIRHMWIDSCQVALPVNDAEEDER